MSYVKEKPIIASSAFVAADADIIGKVQLEENCSVWFHAVLRGDVEAINVGKNSNVQDNATIHCSADHPVTIGENVTVGHHAIVHGATVKDNALIGMGAIVLDGAVIGENSIIGAGALVGGNKEIPPNSLVLGVPGKIIRTVSAEEAEGIRQNAVHYIMLAKEYQADNS